MIDINAMTTGLNLPVRTIKIKNRPDVPYVSWQDTRAAIDARAAEHGVTVSYEILSWELDDKSAKVHARLSMTKREVNGEYVTVSREALAQEIIGRGQAPPLEVAESSAFKRAAMRFGFSAGVNGEWASESRPQAPPPAEPAWKLIQGSHCFGVDSSLRVWVRQTESGHFEVKGTRNSEPFELVDGDANQFVTLQEAKMFAAKRYHAVKHEDVSQGVGKILCSQCGKNQVYNEGGVCGVCQIDQE